MTELAVRWHRDASSICSSAKAATLAMSWLCWVIGAPASAQGGGWTYNPSAKNPTQCAQDKASAAGVQRQIDELTAQRNAPQYSGSGVTIYLRKMQALQSEASAIGTNERTVCDGLVYTPPAAAPGMVTVISPIVSNNVKDPGPSPSGLTVAIAGDANDLYAVSLNGALWKSHAGGTWTHLSRSPRYSHSIAIDPTNSNHLLVGERGDDAASPKADSVGLWESSDAGTTWSFVFNPLTRMGCSSQAVPSVAFSNKGDEFFATTCGVGHRAVGSSTVSFSGNPRGVGPITKVTASETKIWARTATELLVPQSDGSWQSQTIPTNMRASTAPHPAHDEFALAAFDQAAYFSCCDDPSLPKKCGSLNDLVIFRAQSASFAFLPNTKKGKPLFGCSGQGLGGSRFVKTFVAKSAGKSNEPATQRLFFSSAQEIYESVSVAADGGITEWTMPLGATCGGCTNQDPVHSDFWDFLLAPDGNTEWIANDGGVYRKNLAPRGPWRLWDQGLATHHAHTLTLASQGNTMRLLYPTSDDDAWFTTGSVWGREGVMGDVNWSVGDAANPNIALAERRTGSCLKDTCAALVGFGKNVPGGKSVRRAQLSEDPKRDGPEFFNFVQTLPGETNTKFELDAVMLATLPLQFADGSGLHDVKGPLGTGAGPLSGSAVLVRNPDFADNPDIEHSKGKGWTLFADNLPADASRFWIAGGHNSPVVYVMTSGQNSSPRLFKAVQLPKSGVSLSNTDKTTWTELNVQGSIFAPKPYPASEILDGTQTFGPIFVNPYNSDEVYALTSSGVMVSETGGVQFVHDPVLSNLITANGKYTLTGAFGGGNPDDVKIASRAIDMGSLADLSFDRVNSKIAVAVSPFSGVFFKDETGSWFDLSGFLPSPMPLVSDARFYNDYIYVTTEGAGVLQMSHYRQLVAQVTANTNH